MSPADREAVDHIAADLTHLSDTDLQRLAADNAYLPGECATAVRHAIDGEIEFRRAYRHAFLAVTR
ncbi:hypothetical protein ACGF5C_31740 [Micromonospora sp. NPDC047620]|uniref:hypothetical protein n=1 Tax=Micromonospora sp. NPDC047620 TaxID=3364251 RepID=UPI00371C961B